ncbi:Ppx/GppA family phosphatase [Hazenella sp. IB182357]|uniref:Chaperone protein DnaK n=1 Tax=Polycladospora coralii TaxID=2771432 RepID=A0A926NAR7_9BACL|nr:Ppx/GppA family phosphatase [Polycladospora coralii]MBD1373087.1 Ppx/GppA family phosphatase [Polycladospora coralii]MBS7529567.1 Ppx/GppA family phosphatase [Polycladospora coralii]
MEIGVIKRFAVIDIGSNTIRLVVYEWGSEQNLYELYNYKVPIRLRQYLDENQKMREAGIQLTISTLHKFKQAISGLAITHLDVIATAAFRLARNNKEMVAQIKQETGYQVRILSEKEEAYYGYRCIMYTTYVKDGVIVDIGGGSTEVTLVKDRKMVNSHSFSFGSVTLKQLVEQERTNESKFEVIHRFLEENWKAIPWVTNLRLPLIGLGGTVRSLAKVHAQFHRRPLYDIHQYQMIRSEVKQTIHHIMNEHDYRKSFLDVKSETRDDALFPAVWVIQSLMNDIRSPYLLISRKGLREGLILTSLKMRLPRSGRELSQSSLRKFLAKHDITEESHHIAACSNRILQALERHLLFALYTKDYLALKRATLFSLVQHAYPGLSAKGLFHLLSRQSLDGISQKSQMRSIYIACFSSKLQLIRLYKPYMNWFSEKEWKKIELMGAVLLISKKLMITKRKLVEKVEVNRVESGLQICFYCLHDYTIEKQEVNRVKRHLEHVLNCNISILFQRLEKASIEN